MSKNQSRENIIVDWETATERENRIHHEFYEQSLILMMREPPLEIFYQSLNIEAMINLCCTFEDIAEILKYREPQIAELYNIFDFESVYERVDDAGVVRSIMNHFKPKKVLLGSAIGRNLPIDLLRAFTLNSPRILMVKLRGFGQRLIQKTCKFEEVYIENSIYDNSAEAVNAILQSSRKLEKIEIVNGRINDITSTILSSLGLELFTLKHVEIQSCDIESFVSNITKQAFMKHLCLRYFEKIDQNFISALLNEINSMNLISLEISLGKSLTNMGNIKGMSSLKFIRLNIEEHTPSLLMQELRNLIIERPDVIFNIYVYCSCGNQDAELPREHFNEFENVAFAYE